jgi:3-methyladenine DNA glycosylase AlkD
VARTVETLRRLGTPARARGAEAYFKDYESLQFFGVDAASVRRLASQLRRDEGRDWGLRDAMAFTEAMLAHPQLEAKGVGICLLGKYRAMFTPALLGRAKRWLADHCTDWASTDNLCGDVIGPLIERRPALVVRLRTWRTSRHLYVRRASAVALIPSVRHGQALDDAYEAARVLGGDGHHLLRKAAGWLLREAGKADAARLAAFLRRHGKTLSRTTISYAIERFAPDTRRQLLAETRR